MALTISDIDLFQALKEKLGENQAKMLTAFIEEKIEKKVEGKFNDKKDNFASKQDVSEAKVDIIKWIIGSMFGMLLTLSGLIVSLFIHFSTK